MSSFVDYVFVFFGSSILTFFGIFLFQKLFYRFGLLDNPEKYTRNRSPVPYGMGIVFFFVFIVFSVVFFLFSWYNNETIFIKHMFLLVFWWVITLVSFWDDRKNIPPKIRLLIQIAIGMILGISVIQVGYIFPIFSYFLGENILLYSPILPFVFTTCWYVFIFNAVNWSDGIPGNTSGLMCICFFVLFLLGIKLFISQEYASEENILFFLSVTALLVGSLVVFFFFDVREKILMWDSGTMFLWFLLASMAIIVGGKIATVVLVFWVYIVDALYVVIRRIFSGKNPLQWDNTHFHHRLLHSGMSEKMVRTSVHVSAFLFGCSALFLSNTEKILLFFVIVCFVIFFPKIFQYFYKKTTWK